MRSFRAIPHHELAAYALYGKGDLLKRQHQFRGATEAFHTLIRRFPKHPLAIEGYIAIGSVYALQAHVEYPDKNFLDLAKLNLKKFQEHFPREEKLQIAERDFANMQNHYAKCFYETGRFYETTKKLDAAKIYYQKIAEIYPESGGVCSKSTASPYLRKQN